MKTAKLLGVFVAVLFMLFFAATPVMAEGKTSFVDTPAAAAGIGAGIVIVGAGLGFARIGAAALESMARQPEVAPRIFTSMLIIGAFLEGATLFALVVCFQLAGKG